MSEKMLWLNIIKGWKATKMQTWIGNGIIFCVIILVWKLKKEHTRQDRTGICVDLLPSY